MLARSGSWSTVLVPPSCQTPRCAHLWRKVNPKSPLQKQFCSRNSEFVPRFNQTKEKKIFLPHLLESPRSCPTWGMHAREPRAARACSRGREAYLHCKHRVNGGLESWKLLKSTILTAELGYLPGFSHLPPAVSRRGTNSTGQGLHPGRRVLWTWQGNAAKGKQHLTRTALPGMGDPQLMFPTWWKGQKPDFWRTAVKGSPNAPGFLAAWVTVGWEIIPLLLHTLFHCPLHKAK